ncbi:unnamed protein product [Cunninghamella blakesleeana]
MPHSTKRISEPEDQQLHRVKRRVVSVCTFDGDEELSNINASSASTPSSFSSSSSSSSLSAPTSTSAFTSFSSAPILSSSSLSSLASTYYASSSSSSSFPYPPSDHYNPPMEKVVNSMVDPYYRKKLNNKRTRSMVEKMVWATMNLEKKKSANAAVIYEQGRNALAEYDHTGHADKEYMFNMIINGKKKLMKMKASEWMQEKED